MKTIYKRPAYEISKKEYLEGRTLICVIKFDSADKEHTIMPHEADYELRFRLCGDKYVPIFVSEQEYVRLMADYIDRMRIHSAFEAEKRTLESVADHYGAFERQRIATYIENLSVLLSKNAKDVEKTFGGEGK